MQMFAMLVFSYGGGGEPELSMGPFCVTRFHPTHELTDPTRPTITEKIGLNPTQPNYHFFTPSDLFPVPVRSAVKSNLTAWYNQILSNRALNALTLSFQICSTFATVDPTQATKTE